MVFRARGSNGQKFALKRLYVNEEPKLAACKREIQIMVSGVVSHAGLLNSPCSFCLSVVSTWPTRHNKLENWEINFNKKMKI